MRWRIRSGLSGPIAGRLSLHERSPLPVSDGVSPLLLAEIRRALAYPKLARLVPPADSAALVVLLDRTVEVAADPPGQAPVRTADPKHDYLVASAATERAVIVSGDAHLAGLAGRIPVRTPAESWADLERTEADLR